MRKERSSGDHADFVIPALDQWKHWTKMNDWDSRNDYLKELTRVQNTPESIRAVEDNVVMDRDPTYPARQASVTELERLSDEAPELGLGSAGNPRLWADANRAMLHPGYAVSKELIDGAPGASPGEGTVWTLSSGLDALLTVWWVRLKRTPVTPRPIFAALITMQPKDYVALGPAVIDAAQLAEAHHVAGEFLRAAGI